MLLAFDGHANATCRTYRRVGIATRSTWTWWLRDAGFFPALHQHSQQTTPLQHFAGARVMSQQRFPAQVATAASSFYTPPAFQFNPGYATLWRRFRWNFAKTHRQFRFYRQRRWTNYFLAVGRTSGLATALALCLSVVAVLVDSWFSEAAQVLRACSGGEVFINGLRCSRGGLVQLYSGDCVQLTTPNTHTHTPPHLEIDYLANSIFLLHAPIAPTTFAADCGLTACHALRVYNWKYIT